MFRIDGPGATNDNKFTQGDPANGTKATVVTDEWLNAIQEELANAIEAFESVLDKSDSSQLASVLDKAAFRSQLASIAEGIAGLTVVGGRQFWVAGWHAGSQIGGGLIVGDESVSKSDHNGISIFSPTVPPVSEQTGATLVERTENYRSGNGETDPSGQGCFVKLFPRIFSEVDAGYSGASSIISPDTISDDGNFFSRSPSQDGLLVSGKTLTDGSEHIFDNAGRAFSVADNRGIRLSKHGEADIPRLVDQIAQNVETFVTDGDRIYALIKGSYSLNDSSLLANYQVTANGLEFLANTVDLGTGANCRAMATANGYLYIFKDSTLLVFKTEDYAPPVLIATVARPAAGFVQTCSIINGLLVAPVWGDSRIETYSINERGYPVLHQNFTVTAGSNNSSIVDANDGSFLLIRHVSGTDALGRFHFNGEKKIVDMQYFDVPEMLQCRYGVVRNTFLYTGSFSTGDLVEVALAPEVITGATRTFNNMSSFILYDNYILGADMATGDNSAINLDSGVTYPLESGLRWIHPQVYGDTFITFINGDETKPAGATANDSPMGQKIAVYKLRNNAALDYPKSPVVRSLKSINTEQNCESSYELAGLVSGYNPVGSVKQLDGLDYAWLELKVSGFVIDSQASSSSAYKIFEGRALLLYSGGAWNVKQAYADDVAKGTSGVSFGLSTGVGIGFGINAPASLSGAIVRLKVEIRSQNSTALSL